MNRSKRVLLTVIQTISCSVILTGCLTAQAQTEPQMETQPVTPVETQPQNQTETKPETPMETQPSPANAGKICLTEENLPANIQYVVIGKLDKSKVTYGSKDSLYPAMAEEAKKLGANAVIQVDDFLAPSWFGWATPHLKGQAIKLDDLSALDKVHCQWF